MGSTAVAEDTGLIFIMLLLLLPALLLAELVGTTDSVTGVAVWLAGWVNMLVRSDVVGVGVWVKRWVDVKEDGVLDAKDGEGVAKEAAESRVGVRRDKVVGVKEVSKVGNCVEDAV